MELLEEKELQNVRLLGEMTRYDIIRGASPEPWKDPMSVRIRGYQFRFAGIHCDREAKELILKFNLSAAGHTNQSVYIQLVDFFDLLDANESSEKKVSLPSLLNTVIMQGEVKVYCTCPAWIYTGSKYIATKLGYAYGSQENRFPRIRNPKLMGTVCKHAFIILKALPYQKFGIASMIKKELKL